MRIRVELLSRSRELLAVLYDGDNEQAAIRRAIAEIANKPILVNSRTANGQSVIELIQP